MGVKKGLKKDENILDFFNQAERLKSTVRYGARKKAVRESAADHSWKMALMVFILIDEFGLNINKEKALEMALIHDLAESITGDIDHILVVQGKISPEAKKRAEDKAMQKITNKLFGNIGKIIYNLWLEYERGATKEAQFVRAIDKTEALTHLLQKGYPSFYNDKPELIPNHANELIKKFPELIGFLKIIKEKLRVEFHKGGVPWRDDYNMKKH